MSKRLTCVDCKATGPVSMILYSRPEHGGRILCNDCTKARAEFARELATDAKRAEYPREGGELDGPAEAFGAPR